MYWYWIFKRCWWQIKYVKGVVFAMVAGSVGWAVGINFDAGVGRGVNDDVDSGVGDEVDKILH